LNQAALNCLRVEAVNGGLGVWLEKLVTLLRKPLVILAFRLVTQEMDAPLPVHTARSLVVSKSIAKEIAATLMPETILMVTGKVMVSPTAQVEELKLPMVLVIFCP
jgi:hypothetical protein